ncbi:methionine aminopeptidase [Nadsonia fulvescens var. elongata DSM 6958]|uniref:Methionine aminopeptidase n=1 Tax=Nadsonia fulvescens var. elongata DSM 6958 TaxID=857566 RepID=A0A1E3PI41_9ASCO|nr:methionine aminopeptidase [Nadsonia fulvescens var. elongata DSM 6958]
MAESLICSGADCGKPITGSLKCPNCLKSGVSSSFCSKDCFKRNWKLHKSIHPVADKDTYDPFPTYAYTGDLRAQYPLTPRAEVDASVGLPDYARDGQPRSEQKLDRTNKIEILTKDEIEIMKNVSMLGREVLDAGAAAVKPGITTEEIDAIVHKACMDRGAYPSPLNYYNFPKSVCTSVNEVICHGIPDKRPLVDGDIVNLDISIYKDGYHSDLNETYYVGDKAKCNPDLVRLVETTRECLDLAIKTVKPGLLFRQLGDTIEKHAKANNCAVVRTYCGHGINSNFHCAPNVPHYARNKAVGIAKAGMTFTIEPMLTLGSYKDKMWPDNWTAVTVDGSASAQFEHLLLVTETGCEVITARKATSPGGPVPRI